MHRELYASVDCPQVEGASSVCHNTALGSIEFVAKNAERLSTTSLVISADLFECRSLHE